MSLNIPAGTQNADKLRIRGKGVENVQTKKKGDMYIITKIMIPEKLTRTQKVLVEELNDTDLETNTEFKKFKKFLK